VHVSEQLENVL